MPRYHFHIADGVKSVHFRGHLFCVNTGRVQVFDSIGATLPSDEALEPSYFVFRSIVLRESRVN